MSSSKPSDQQWQVISRKNRAPPQTASSGLGLQNTNDRGPPNTQLLSQTPNGRHPPRVPPSRVTVPNGHGLQNPQPPSRPAPASPSLPKPQPKIPPAPKKKEEIPYEIKNAREWDPRRRMEGETLSESSDDDDYEDSDYEYPQVFGDVSSDTADDGFPTVFNKRSQSSALPPNQSSGHSKVRSHDKPPGQRRARPRANFDYKRENLARAAFRKRLDPTGRFMLPKDCPDIEPNQKRMYDFFHEIGVRLGSFVRPPQDVKDRELLLWGDTRQIKATIFELQRWLDSRLRTDTPRKSMAKDKFAREFSSSGDLYHRLVKKMQREAKILEFQRVPMAGRFFAHVGTFIWPTEEVQPEDILGSSLEALDPIRFQYHCHITFDNKLSSFRIFSDNPADVKKTMDRLEGTMKEYVAKSARPEMIILVEPPSSSAIRKEVKILSASLNDRKSMIPLVTGRALDPAARNEWLNKSKQLTIENNRRMALSLRKCIANLPHHRGLIRMRVQFGTFALERFRGGDSTPIEEFMNNMTISGTKAVMIRDLQVKKDATTIISKVQKATDLLLPMDSSNVSLEEAVPSFSACFEFKNPGSPPMNFTLEMSSSAAAPTIYEKVQELWTRADRRDNGILLEAFMARLDGGASWKLQVSTENGIDASRINAKMIEFAESVRLSKIPRTRIELTGQRAFTWRKDLPGVMQPSTFQQKTALKYRLAHHPEWEFEIARYDNYGNPKNEDVPVETNWGATLYNTNWDSILTANSTLGIGEEATWDPKLDTFFPSGPDTVDTGEADPNVTEFLKNVEVVTKFIDSIKKELPHLRG